MAVKNLSTLIVSSSFNRLLQVNPDDNITIIDGTGSVFLISTGSISNWSNSVDYTVSGLGYLRELDGVVFTSKSNTGSIRLKGDIEINGDLKVYSGSSEMVSLDRNGFMKLSSYQGDLNVLSAGSMIYSGSEFYFITD